MPTLLPLLNADQLLEAYAEWLASQPLAPSTRHSYQEKVAEFCHYLKSHPVQHASPFQDEASRDYAVRDFKTFLQTHKKLKPSSINLALAGLDHFYHFLQMGKPQVQREDLPRQAPRSLELADQKELLRAIARQKQARNRVVALLLLYTGLRIGECAALNQSDVNYSSRKGMLTVRSGKGSRYREVPLNSAVRTALKDWETERKNHYARFEQSAEPALFLNRQGKRLSRRAIDLLLRKIAQEAGVNFSAHTLRHTCLTNLVRGGNDLVLVAEIAGHKRLETTRRYSLPTLADRARALEELKMEY